MWISRSYTGQHHNAKSGTGAEISVTRWPNISSDWGSTPTRPTSAYNLFMNITTDFGNIYALIYKYMHQVSDDVMNQ